MKTLWICALGLIAVSQASAQHLLPVGRPSPDAAVTLPVAVNAPHVRYPKGAPFGRYVVSVAFTVDEQGIPRHPHIVQSDNDYFDFSAMVTALEWRFKPAMRDGEPVATPLTLSLAFNKKPR